MLAFNMDDSADQKQEKIYVVAGYLGQSEVWFETRRHWEARVKREGLDYFRTTDCYSLTGEFEKLVRKYGRDQARKISDQLLSDLWLIIKAANLGGFCFLGPMPAYREVRAESYSEYVFASDPYVQAHEHVIYNVARWVCDNVKPSEPVAFAFDEHNKAAILQERWAQQKLNSPIAAPCMGSLISADDRRTPSIQMADLLANTTKRAFEDRMHDPSSGLEHLKRSCGQNLTWVACWNEDYLRELREASIDAATKPSLAFEFKPGHDRH